MSRRYARILTKEELIKSGITAITEDARVFKGAIEVTPKKLDKATGYLMLNIYDTDAEGNFIKRPKKDKPGYSYKVRRIGLHRVVYAWMYGCVPEGLVVDHINNKHDDLVDYNINNLQLSTQLHNNHKDRTQVKEAKMPKNKKYTRQEILDKIDYYQEQNRIARDNNDKDKAHSIRGCISDWKAKLRAFDANPELYIKIEEKPATDPYYHKKAECRRQCKKLSGYYKETDKNLWHYYSKMSRQNDFSLDDLYSVNVAYSNLWAKN